MPFVVKCGPHATTATYCVRYIKFSRRVIKLKGKFICAGVIA